LEGSLLAYLLLKHFQVDILKGQWEPPEYGHLRAHPCWPCGFSARHVRQQLPWLDATGLEGGNWQINLAFLFSLLLRWVEIKIGGQGQPQSGLSIPYANWFF